MILSPTLDSANSFNAKDPPRPAIIGRVAQAIASMSRGFRAITLELLVALSGMLTSDDYRRVAVLLWSKCLDSTDPRVFTPVRSLAVSIIKL
jgi:hypothetical protein